MYEYECGDNDTNIPRHLRLSLLILTVTSHEFCILPPHVNSRVQESQSLLRSQTKHTVFTHINGQDLNTVSNPVVSLKNPDVQ